MDEVAPTDFRTDAEREECDGVLPRAEAVRAAFLLVEETATGRHDGKIPGSISSGVSYNLPGDSRIEVRLQNGRSLTVGRGFDPDHARGLLGVVEAAG